MSKKQRGTLQKWNRIEKKNDSSFYETCKPRAICRFDAADQKNFSPHSQSKGTIDETTNTFREKFWIYTLGLILYTFKCKW